MHSGVSQKGGAGDPKWVWISEAVSKINKGKCHIKVIWFWILLIAFRNRKQTHLPSIAWLNARAVIENITASGEVFQVLVKMAIKQQFLVIARLRGFGYSTEPQTNYPSLSEMNKWTGNLARAECLMRHLAFPASSWECIYSSETEIHPVFWHEPENRDSDLNLAKS